MLDAPPYHNAQAAARYEDAGHLVQRGRAIRKELQPQLTVHSVEGRVRKGHVRRAGLTPRYRGTRGRCVGGDGGGHGQHARIQVETHDVTSTANSFRDQSRDHARTAGDIEHALTGSRGGQLHDQWRPGRKMAGTSARS